jgi:hypothetical protein
MARNDAILVQLLKTLHDRINDLDDNSYDNTVIQYFEVPYDNAYLATQVSSLNTTPGTFTWGGYDQNNTYWSPNWYWGYGGQYS